MEYLHEGATGTSALCRRRDQLESVPQDVLVGEESASLGSGPAFVGTLPRKGALLLHVLALLPPDGATTRGVPNPKILAGLYFTTR